MDYMAWEDLKDRIGFSRLGKPALIGLAALLVLVAALAGKNLVEAATANDFEISRSQESASGGDSSGASGAVDASAPAGEGTASQGASDGQAASSIYAHVAGAVNKPGLVELAPGARVADAVKAAGGFADDAQTGSVNLARVLQDGEQIIVAAQGDQAVVSEGGGAVAPVLDAGGTAASGAVAGSSLVNLNTASASELESLPGVGPATAEKIVSDREANGPFTSPEDLMRVSGIGEKKFAAIADLVCV